MERRIGGPESGKIGVALAFSAVILYVLWQIGGSIVVGNVKSALLLFAVFAAFFVAGRIMNNWRSGVYLFCVWLLFEDLIRKYMGNSMYIYFTKDVLAALTYLSLYVTESRTQNSEFRAPFRYALGAFFILGLVQVFNPLSPSIFYGLLGLKLYYYYIPLMYVGYALIQREEDLRKFLVVNAWMAVIISAVGIIQATLGEDYFNPTGMADIDELAHNTRYTHDGLAVARPPSVFVSNGRFTEYMVLAFILVLGSAGYMLLRPGRGRKIVFAAVGITAVAGVLGGSRGAFVFLVASAMIVPVGMLWGAPSEGGKGYKLVKAIRRSVILVAVAMSLAIVIFPDSVGNHFAFYRETLTPNSEYSEVSLRTWRYPMEGLHTALSDPYWLMGHGIGTGSLGVQYVTRIMDAPPSGVGVENGWGAVVVEFGILGLALWLLWTVSLLWSAVRVTLKLRGTWAFPVALATVWFIFLLIFPMTFGSMVEFQNFVANAYLWLMVGILFRLPSLVNKTDAAEKEAFEVSLLAAAGQPVLTST